jgi:hypothetical protein
VNAPLGLTPRNAPPKPGAIFCADGLGGFARPGHWLEFDASGGGLINLSTGDRMALPGAGGRQANGMMFGAPPSPTDVHVSLPIAGWLAGYRQPGQFLLDTLVQQQPVDFTQFKYRNMSGSNTFLVHDVRASELSSPPQVQMSSSVTEDKTQDLRVAIFLPYRTEQQADFNFEVASARVAWNAIMLWREYQAFKSGGTFMTSGSWASAVRLALGATYNWGPPGSEGADSDPPRDLRTARLASQAPITHFAMSLKQFDWFTQHPKTIDHYKSFGRDGVTAGMIRDIVQQQALAGPNAQSPVEFDIPMIGKGLIHNARATTSAGSVVGVGAGPRPALRAVADHAAERRRVHGRHVPAQEPHERIARLAPRGCARRRADQQRLAGAPRAGAAHRLGRRPHDHRHQRKNGVHRQRRRRVHLRHFVTPSASSV